MGSLLLLQPASAAAHTELQWSRPAAGETVAGSPAELRLRFTTRVEPRYTQLSLQAADGREIALPSLQAEDNRREFFVLLPEPLPAGSYRVHWRTAGADGHIIQGSFGFAVHIDVPDDTTAEPALPLPPAPDAPHDAEHAPPGFGTPAYAEPTSALSVASRFLHFAALLALIGAVAFRYGVLRRLVEPPGSAALADACRPAVLAIAGLALGLLAGVAVLRLWLQSVALHGAGDAWSPEYLGVMLSGTLWGRAWVLQAAALAVGLAGFLLARRAGGAARGWPLLAFGALGLASVPALSGHAAAAQGIGWIAVLNDTLHVLGAGSWLGSLAVLLAVGVPAALRSAAGERASAVAALVNRFSQLALAAAALVVATGVINALFHFNAPAELWTTAYGRTLLLKLAVLLPVLGLGAYNWRVVRPALGTDAATGRLQRSAGVEIAVGSLVVLITAVLVALPRP